MRTLTETLAVPAQPAAEVLVTNYGCDECDFVARSKSEIPTHVARTHAVRDRIAYGDAEALRFNSEADANAWLGIQSGDRVRMDWQGPGWYVSKEYSEPCGHGCCRKWVYELVPLGTYLAEIQEEGRDKLRTYFRLRKVVAEKEQAHAP
jgi:hypothetical protein